MKFGAVMGIVCTTFWVGTALIAWVRYPDCGSDHVAAFAFYNTNTLWVCAKGYDPVWTELKRR